MVDRDIIAIGASAGGVQAICQLLAKFPADLPAALLVTLHRPINVRSHLPQVLQSNCRLHVRVACDGDSLEHGTCYIAPFDRHLTVCPGPRVRLLLDGFYRAHTIDALFTSLAYSAGNRAIGVVLSGLLKDGALGLQAIKETGGLALVQDPAEAMFPEMPLSAIQYAGDTDYIGRIDQLAEFIMVQVSRSSVRT